MTCPSSGGMLPARALSRACWGVRAPGMAHVTPSNIRIHCKCELRHRCVVRHEVTQAFHRRQPDIIGHSRKRFALVEHLAFAIERAVIVGRKPRHGSELAGQKTARQWNPGEDADLLRQRFGEDPFRRLEAEHVEDNLNTLHVRVLHRVERLVGRLNADPVVAQLAGGNQVVQNGEGFRLSVERRWRAMELEEIDRLDFEVREAAVDPCGQVVPAVSFTRLLRQAASGLGRDPNRVPRPLAPQLRDQPLAASVAVDVCRIDEVDAVVDRRMQRRHRGRIVYRAPAPADRPCAKPDSRNVHVGTAKPPLFHAVTLSSEHRIS